VCVCVCVCVCVSVCVCVCVVPEMAECIMFCHRLVYQITSLFFAGLFSSSSTSTALKSSTSTGPPVGVDSTHFGGREISFRSLSVPSLLPSLPSVPLRSKPPSLLYNMVLTTTSKPTFLPWSLFDYLSYY